MGQVDTFGAYVRTRLEDWGREFALHRDCEYLGHQAVNMLQVLIDHKGEMPPRNTGLKPLECGLEALRVEQVVTEIARGQRQVACVLRAYYCGSGRRKVERWETANLLIAYAGLGVVNQRQYLNLHEIGFDMVREKLSGMRQAA